MAGRVLRNSRGQFAGSTGGWGRGRVGRGGGFGNGRKGKVRSLSGFQRQQRITRTIRRGGSVGVAVGASLAGAALAHKGASHGNVRVSLAGLGLTVVGQAATVHAKRTIGRRR
jgi:hypothetical protein